MTPVTYDLSYDDTLMELQAALGRPVNVMIRPAKPGAQPHVIAHMSGRLMRAESKYAGPEPSPRVPPRARASSSPSCRSGSTSSIGYDGFYITELQFGGARSVAGEKADRMHIRVGDFELLIAIARVPADDDEADDE